MKRLLMLVTAVGFALVLSACSNDTTRDQDPNDEDLMEYTLAELAEFDGKDGAKAYIAVDGLIYDVTDDPNWTSGSHNGFTAGLDLTEEIASLSPHGTSVLDGVPVVGTLVDDTSNNEDYLYLTLAELAEFDGQNGAKAYIVVDGLIYDVTDNSNWNSGTHNGYAAGQDLTDEIMNSSPHGTSVLNGVPVVGELVVE